MTYEQAGHSRAGLGVLTAEGDTLTLGETSYKSLFDGNKHRKSI
jgi:hypothetical protein